MSVVTQNVKLNHATFFVFLPACASVCLPHICSLSDAGGEPFVVEAEGEVIEALVEDGDFIATSLAEVDPPGLGSDLDNSGQVRDFTYNNCSPGTPLLATDVYRSVR